MVSILIEIIKVLGPILVTITTYCLQAKANRRHQAKQSILQEITEDKVSWYCDHKFPENQQRIQEEYDVYHENGGNGTVTRKVNEYFAWVAEINKEALSQTRSNNRKGGSYGK